MSVTSPASASSVPLPASRFLPAEAPVQTELASPPHSPALAGELERITTSEQAEHDRRQQAEIARLRELARFD